MSQISEFDSTILGREVVGWGAARVAAPVLPLPNALFNERFVAEPYCLFRDNLSVRSLGAVSPFYRSRPASPISERDPLTWAARLGMFEDLKEARDSETAGSLAATHQDPHTASPGVAVNGRVEAGVQTNDVCLRFPKTGLMRRKLTKKRTRKTRSVEIPREEAELEFAQAFFPPLPPPLDPHLRNKISKVRSFWGRLNRALPTTFKVSYLCPLRRQREFLDFSHKEILLEESPSNDILCKSSLGDGSVSRSGFIQPHWADDFDQVTFAD